IRHLDILLIDPWIISLGRQEGVPLPERMDVQVANPLCLMVQKFLIQQYRPAKRRAQDVRYIYDTIELFGALLDEFNTHWNAQVAPALGGLADDVRRISVQTFAEVNDMVRDTARIPADRNLPLEQIQATCSYAFERMLRS
uniref:GSU2403 family nucleotidyltransferase fold protein n=1 Tax=Calothrix sp. FACHB-1219 TaxID=2692778 RepID=UPI0018EF68E8|nr:hypothetical protein [Calothrix sp. FACHB-1219]